MWNKLRGSTQKHQDPNAKSPWKTRTLVEDDAEKWVHKVITHRSPKTQNNQSPASERTTSLSQAASLKGRGKSAMVPGLGWSSFLERQVIPNSQDQRLCSHHTSPSNVSRHPAEIDSDAVSHRHNRGICIFSSPEPCYCCRSIDYLSIASLCSSHWSIPLVCIRDTIIIFFTPEYGKPKNVLKSSWVINDGAVFASRQSNNQCTEPDSSSSALWPILPLSLRWSPELSCISMTW